SQTMIMGHTVDLQVFYTDDPIRVDDVPALLMGEVLAFPCDAFMHAGNNFAVLAAFRRILSELGVLALHLCQDFLFFAEKARVCNLRSIGKRSKGFQPDINANL